MAGSLRFHPHIRTRRRSHGRGEGKPSGRGSASRCTGWTRANPRKEAETGYLPPGSSGSAAKDAASLSRRSVGVVIAMAPVTEAMSELSKAPVRVHSLDSARKHSEKNRGLDNGPQKRCAIQSSPAFLGGNDAFLIRRHERQAPLFSASSVLKPFFTTRGLHGGGLVSTPRTHKRRICPSANKGISEVDAEVLKAICS